MTQKRDARELILTELPRLTRDEAARAIADTLRCGADGPLHAPATWRAFALARGLEVEETAAHGEGKGEYHPASGEGAICGIVVNTTYPPEEQARAYIHELAHHFLHAWIPPQLANAADIYCYAGDVDEARHDIARMVEGLILG